MSVFADDFNPSGTASVEALRVYLILVWFHGFVMNVSKDTVTRLHLPFAESISKLRPAFRNSLASVTTFQSLRHSDDVSSAMSSEDKVDPQECRVFLDILASLSAINRVSWS
ncbi:hypothetical protein COOONC_15198 [Cooperia oncophora]